MKIRFLLVFSLAFASLACSPDRDRGEPIEPIASRTAEPVDAGDLRAIEDAARAVDAAAARFDVETGTGEAADTDRTLITVHKTATCGCCAAWVDHLKREGFDVAVVDHPELAQVKQEMGVPRHLHSCHTGEVNGLFVEGHVPAQDIRSMLELASQDEAIDGIAVPGMPMGSPGMEAGGATERYDVILVSGEEESVLNSHGTL